MSSAASDVYKRQGQNTANYFKDKDVTAQGGNCSHSILGWFSTDFRKLKILSKHLLPQGDGFLARASLIAVLCTMQA